MTFKLPPATSLRSRRRSRRSALALVLAVMVAGGAMVTGANPARATVTPCSEYVTVFQTTSDGRWTGPGTSTQSPGEFSINNGDPTTRYVTMGGVTRPRRSATFRFVNESDVVVKTKTTVASGDNGVIRQEPNVIPYDFTQPGQRIRVFADFHTRCGGDDVLASNRFVGTIVTTDPALEGPPSPPDTEVPGGGATLSGPAAVAFQGSEYVFVRGGDDRLYVNRFDGSNWTGWSHVPGNHATPSALAATVHFGVLFLIHRGVDNRIYWDRFDGSTWTSLGEVCCAGFTPDAPAVTSHNGELVVVVRGTDNAIYQNRFNRFTNTWSGWAVVPGGWSTPSAPAATVFNNGAVDLLQLAVRGLDSRIYTNRFNPFDGSWSGWAEIPGGFATPSAPDLTVSAETLDVAIRGLDNQLYLNRFDGVNWLGWRPLPNLAPTADDPALSVFNNTLSVYTRVDDNRIFKTLAPVETPLDLDGDGAGATSAAAAASLVRIRCTPKSSNPIRRLGTTTMIGSGSTTCKFVGGGPATMAALTVNVALWRATTGPDGRSRFWALVDHKFLPDVAVDGILETISMTCKGSQINHFVITTLHTAVPPPNFTPRFRSTVTTSDVVLEACS